MNTPIKAKPEDRPMHSAQGDTGAADRAKELASTVGQKAKEAACTVGHKAEEAGSFLGQKAEDAASFVGQKAVDAASAVGGSLKSLGQAIREHTPQGGSMGGASSAVANSLESTGRYLQEEGLRGMTEDMTNLIRRNPIPALFVGIGVGFLLARATNSQS